MYGTHRKEPAVSDRAVSIFAEGVGNAAETTGILNDLQGRIFGLLYLEAQPLSLDDIASELQQSKSHISVNIRRLVEWSLVRRVRVEGSRKDYYEAETDFWRVIQEILERRFRWNIRVLLSAVEESQQAIESENGTARHRAPGFDAMFAKARLAAIHAFFTAMDEGIADFTRGRSFEPETVREALRLVQTEPAKHGEPPRNGEPSRQSAAPKRIEVETPDT